MKIVHYFDKFIPLLGGVQTHIDDIVTNMDDVEFKVLTNAIPETEISEQHSNNVIVHRVTPNDRTIMSYPNRNISKISFPIRLFFDIVRNRRKRSILQRETFDILHVHGPALSPNFIRVDTMLGKKMFSKIIDFSSLDKSILLTLHGIDSLFTDNKILEENEQSYILNFKNIICVDEYIFEYVKTFCKETKIKRNIWYIPNAVNTDTFAQTSIPNGNKLKVGFVCRYDPLHGINLAAELSKNLPEFIEFHIAIAADSEKINKFKSMCNVNNIELYENVEPERMPDFFQDMDLILNLRTQDGIGRITLEAMSCGRPVVMLDIGNRFPVIHEKTGFLIKNNIDDLISILNRLHLNRNEIVNAGQRAREKILDKYSIESFISQHREIYNTLE